MSSEANGHMPTGYYVVRKESGRKVLYSPYKIPVTMGSVYVPGREPRPVASWTATIGNKKIHEMAAYDRDVMERRVGASIALEELREVFRS